MALRANGDDWSLEGEKVISANIDVQAKIIASMMEVMTSEEIKYWFSGWCEVCC